MSDSCPIGEHEWFFSEKKDALVCVNCGCRRDRQFYHTVSKEGSESLMVGDKVMKCTGDYQWEGVICSVFATPGGLERFVVGHPVDNGWVLHIYSRNNLRKIP